MTTGKGKQSIDSFWIKKIRLRKAVTVLVEKLNYIIFATQEQAIQTNTINSRFDKSQEISEKVNETINVLV